MKTNRFLLIYIISTFIISCGKKEELYEVEIPDSVYISEEEVENSPSKIIAKDGSFKMKGLSFEYSDLEPMIDAQTVEIHYSKHHLAYLEKLNELIKGTDLEEKSIEEIMTSLDSDKKALIENAGGYFNHNLYWEVLTKGKEKKPTGKIADLINRDFGSFEAFKTQFKKAGIDLNGSGWVWLILTDDQNLKISTTINQNNPLMPFETIKGYPLMNLDMWEHAYYLKYKNNKKDYIDNYFKLIDWDKLNYRIELKSN
ncbi:superoxide dismutase [Flavobacterium sp. I3-2]|uniref:superoxide dismutase n=1 Tax=Flavobacterium sp. I3-2 TaxID=2748319 RepID=UPI0015AECC96|nr:superoxide dismutase [Flavobacterium sp. I3-2]